MAASSTYTASSSASTSYSPYDIFINHRGPDVKNTFASHLYRRLISSGMRVFLDREELEEGQNISSQIEHAICGASVHIAILSPTYAESSWCLEELVLMKNSGATILPVFFKVEPSVVRHTVKHGAYAEALRKLQEKRTNDPETGEDRPRYGFGIIQNWRDALSYVADMSGFVHGDQDDEGELLDKVVEGVLKRVPKAPLNVAKYATGLGEKLQDFETAVLLQQHDENRLEAQVVGIVGVGGVGKTTLAKEFFNLRRSDYVRSSFLFEVRENARTVPLLSKLQNKLLSDLKNDDFRSIDSPDEGKEILRKQLSSCHALIILDDIDHLSQLEALLPMRDILSPRSLILVTSRDKHVLRSSGMLESSIYYLKGLNRTHSGELFCSYAFNHPFPPREFADLADRFVTACDGLPLSLRVFGALVCGRNESYWEEILNELDKILPNEIQERLEVSYKKLNTEDKKIFLDVACFFLGKRRDAFMRIWGVKGLENLQDKCLLEVEYERIKMHDHIRDLGRRISQEEMAGCRLWHQTANDIDDLLEKSSHVITEVRGITMLGASNPEGRHANHSISEMPWYKRWSEELFGNCLRHLVNDSRFCGNLYLLATEDGYYLERILKKARSPHLRWLRCFKYPYSYLPSWIPMENLRILDVQGSRLKILWQHESQAPRQLRELTIHASTFSKFPRSIGQLKHLEVIVVADDRRMEGIALKSLPDEFCELRSLKYLELRSCLEMISLPDSFGMLTNLQTLSLFAANSLQMLPNSFGNLTRLKNLDLCFCRNLTISSSTLGNITSLEYLDIRNCNKMTELPPQVAYQRSLRSLRLSGANLKELPSWFGDLSNLEGLSLGNDLFEVLPPLSSYFKSLKKLWLSDSPRLKFLPDHFVQLSQLRWLFILDCGIEYSPQDLPKMNNLELLKVRDCPLRELPFKKIEGERETGRALNKLETSYENDKCMYGLLKLELFRTEISEVIFPEGVCPNLRNLTLQECEKLRQVGGLSGLSKLLRSLDISGCAKVEELPNIEMLISLEVLNVGGCKKLKSIPGLGQLTTLRKLDAHECHEMIELSSNCAND